MIVWVKIKPYTHRPLYIAILYGLSNSVWVWIVGGIAILYYNTKPYRIWLETLRGTALYSWLITLLSLHKGVSFKASINSPPYTPATSELSTQSKRISASKLLNCIN